MTQRRMIFITGASRSGTTLLSFVLRRHADVFGLRELQYFGQAWDPRDAGRRFTRAEAIEAAAQIYAYQDHGVLLHHVEAPHRAAAVALVDALGPAACDPAELFATTVHAIARAAGKSIPCEQTPRYIFYARPLLDFYPGAHIVHLVRDPRAVMASQKNRWRRRKLAADGMSVPRYESVRVWVNYHPYTVGKLWSQATRAALELAQHPRVTIVRYEDLVQSPEQTVRTLCDRLGLEYDPAMLDVAQINSSHQSSAGGARRGMHTDAIDRWRHALTGAETAVTEQICGPLMRRFGYTPVARPRTFWLDQLGFDFSYAVHLAAVLLVNPRRAAVQAKALARSGSAEALFRRVRQVRRARPAGAPAEPPAGPGSSSLPVAGSTNDRGDGPSNADLREFIGLRFWDVALPHAARFVVERAAQGIRTQVYFVNAHCVNEAATHPGYAEVLADSPFVFADGVGMALAARFAGTRLQHNVNGTDLFPLILQAAAAASVPVALLGARPGVAEACAERIQRMYPGLRVVWTEHGYLEPEQEEARLEDLNASGARILFVAKGVPAQECWIAAHAERLAAPVVLGVGALLDFYSGNVKRAPRLVRELRSEWLYRLMLEPRRLSRRYLLGNPAFIARTLLWRSLSHPLARRGGGLT
ncbi:MAG TPA: WecB/TagA/CpsF family glycosyltransferase [Steroidobacteraceae bacterium]|nr:WecB/TagA/CpsF family glycosyltransferase [Steroidobacteraceae bacterium]